MEDYEDRFGGIGRLFGRDGLAHLRAGRVCVIGIGGVGSWAAEAVARSGVGAITLVDMDDLCVTNTNRQLHALDGTIGANKAEVLADRLRAINPGAEIAARPEFFTEKNADKILAAGFDHVIDAIDSVANKCLLISECRRRGLPVVTSGGAGGLQRIGEVRRGDLARSTHDRLLKDVRKKLRREHGFPTDPAADFGVTAVWSTESPVYPGSDGRVCETREDAANLRLDCASGFGTATFVTGALGFGLAEAVVADLVAGKAD